MKLLTNLNKTNMKLQNVISDKHPKCKGFWTIDIGNGNDFDCGYKTAITCEECKYGKGKKNPEAKCNVLKSNNNYEHNRH